MEIINYFLFLLKILWGCVEVRWVTKGDFGGKEIFKPKNTLRCKKFYCFLWQWA